MDALYHHGVKGMKWGIRKDRQTNSNKTKSTQSDESNLMKKKEPKIITSAKDVGKRFIDKVSSSTAYDIMNLAFAVGTGTAATYALQNLLVTEGKRFVTIIIDQQQKAVKKKKERQEKKKQNQNRSSESIELKHHGVKGMRWGIRKEKQKTSTKKSHSDPVKKLGKDFVDSVKSGKKSLTQKSEKVVAATKEKFSEVKGMMNNYMTDKQIAAFFAADAIIPFSKPVTLGVLGYIYLRETGKLKKIGMSPKGNYENKELKHHGVKGMKWGVRRTKEELGYRIYSEQKGDVILKKGTNLQRITTNANSNITKGVYTSYKSSDKDLYKGVLGRMRISRLAQEGKNVTLKEITMTSKEDIRLPSRQVRLEEFKKLYQSNPEGVKKLIKEHDESGKGKYSDDIDNKNLSRKGKLDKTYQRFNDALAMGQNSKNKDVINDYYLQLKKRGYNAIADENDIRLSTFKANAPIILFNSNQSIGKQLTRELSASEVFSAYDRSIGKKTARQLLMPKGIGTEKLDPDSAKKAAKHTEQLLKDKVRLNENYTLNDLANDWGNSRLSRSQINRVSKKMDKGISHDEAVAEVTGLGNVVMDVVLDKLKV